VPANTHRHRRRTPQWRGFNTLDLTSKYKGLAQLTVYCYRPPGGHFAQQFGGLKETLVNLKKRRVTFLCA